jgi:Ca2+/H+ antiporter
MLPIRSRRLFGIHLNYALKPAFCRLIFPRWDVIVIILSVFLMTYTYIEAKSNYHRGSILVLR